MLFYFDLFSGVWVSLGLVFAKPSSLGFIALRTPFHRDPYHWAPPALGDPYPELLLHCFLWFIAVGEYLYSGFPLPLGICVSPSRVSASSALQEALQKLLTISI